MKSTFSKFVLASAVVAAAAFTSIPAMAASEGAATVNVPFSFTVHGKSLPAGTYKVRWDGTGNFVTIQNGNAVDTFIWNPNGIAAADQRVIMKFEEHGQAHTLQSIQSDSMTTPRLTQKPRKNGESAPAGMSTGQ